ncbi:NAD(P)-dependent oxidoreductase [Sunxiuqinia indica]|uniref:NAD(P)-dependent oxidoreductase n=1 Tax=Sunxiuqinia indica TaxID=2692584 RepID=UPI001358040D|nr:NAD(P)-dependent oxidoreductase [Sunxiuqinia indica]
MKIGILRETRRWKDRRVAITPETAELILKNYPDVELVVQSSELRVHKDEEYAAIGIPVVEDVSHCDLLIGVKEVANEALIDGKTYIMFSHVAKEQVHNQEFFKLMAQKNITLIDYEYFVDKHRSRLVAFGFWAGVVGAYYAFMAAGKRFCHLSIPGPEQCRDLSDLHHQLKALELPALKILITGGGRVASGVLEIVKGMGVHEVLPNDFLTREYEHAVYTRLDPEDYVKRKQGKFDLKHFYENPTEYETSFTPYTKEADVYIAAHFWNQQSPVFFMADDLKSPDFSISVISDVSCDVPGPIPTTLRTSTIEEPFYDVEPDGLEEEEAFSSSNYVTVCAVDNLPAALPADASRTFARKMYHEVFPSLFGDDQHKIIERATILNDGELTPAFSYLNRFLKE